MANNKTAHEVPVVSKSIAPVEVTVDPVLETQEKVLFGIGIDSSDESSQKSQEEPEEPHNMTLRPRNFPPFPI